MGWQEAGKTNFPLTPPSTESFGLSKSAKLQGKVWFCRRAVQKRHTQAHAGERENSASSLGETHVACLQCLPLAAGLHFPLHAESPAGVLLALAKT